MTDLPYLTAIIGSILSMWWAWIPHSSVSFTLQKYFGGGEVSVFLSFHHLFFFFPSLFLRNSSFKPNDLSCSLDYGFFFLIMLYVSWITTYNHWAFSINSLKTLKISASTELLFCGSFLFSCFYPSVKDCCPDNTSTFVSQLLLYCKILQGGAESLCLIWNIFLIISILVDILSLICKHLSQKMQLKFSYQVL